MHTITKMKWVLHPTACRIDDLQCRNNWNTTINKIDNEYTENGMPPPDREPTFVQFRTLFGFIIYEGTCDGKPTILLTHEETCLQFWTRLFLGRNTEGKAVKTRGICGEIFKNSRQKAAILETVFWPGDEGKMAAMSLDDFENIKVENMEHKLKYSVYSCSSFSANFHPE